VDLQSLWERKKLKASRRRSLPDLRIEALMRLFEFLILAVLFAFLELSFQLDHIKKDIESLVPNESKVEAEKQPVTWDSCLQSVNECHDYLKKIKTF